MRTRHVLLGVSVALIVVLSGCGIPIAFGGGGKAITPSDVNITETRDVSGFTSIEVRSFGKVTLTQGDSESLTVSGADNLVPLVTTTVSNGTLIIDTEPKVTIVGGLRDDLLTFDITVTDLRSLAVSGVAGITMDGLTTSALSIAMSGAGQAQLSTVSADSVDAVVSGVGSIQVSGKATGATVVISGAGDVNLGDLQCQTVDVTISGLGGATVWATDQLTGNISGAGNVKYYGTPQTNTSSSGAGSFQSEGAK